MKELINSLETFLEQAEPFRDKAEWNDLCLMAEELIEKHNDRGYAEVVEVYSFDEFWDDYDKKVGSKAKLQKKWAKLSNKKKMQIKEYIPLYRQAQPDKRYRKNPETFLNNESWNDEIISAKKGPVAHDYKQSILNKLRAGINAEV